ncbi:tetratricopeptide repeat protein [Roseobacter sp. HKCCA0434]|uniref:tetratricopeptide repeat protein n=1 Tax=Roseobacter sp. HKCCA0434 TaxID=3079297 RepID=UPI002905DFFE|nr:tetratricopeptide repeat protein [Roseobacter sp. HKCCA0434]
MARSLLVALLLMVGCVAQEVPLPPDARTPLPDMDASPREQGHLLQQAGQYELALRAYAMAYATDDVGLPGEMPMAVGTANARLGRMNAARRHLQTAVAEAPDVVEGWNNLGVVEMSLGDRTAARHAFETALSLSDGQSAVARDNLDRLDIRDAVAGDDPLEQPLGELTLVRQGSGRYLLATPDGDGETE